MSRRVLACWVLLAGCAVSSTPSAPAEEEVRAAPEEEARDAPEAEPEELVGSEPDDAPSGNTPALSIPHDMPPLDTPCETRREFATGRVARALEFAAAGCSVDADCVKASRATGCRGACPTAVLEAHAEAYETLRDSVDERVCATYRDDGCPYATPRCAAGSPRCVEGVCEYAR